MIQKDRFPSLTKRNRKQTLQKQNRNFRMRLPYRDAEAQVKETEMIRGIRVEEVVEPLPEAEKTCGVCGTKMQPGGKKYLYDELIYQPAKVYILRHFVETVCCPQCKTSGEKNNIVSAKPERKALIPHSWASPSVVAHMMYEKYANAVPLYRQEKDWQQYGVPLTRAVMANWIKRCSEEYFSPW
jgi:Transposase IS66 family.